MSRETPTARKRLRAEGTFRPSNPFAEVRRSPIEGAGVFATRALRRGALLEDVSRPLVRYSQVPQEGDPAYGHAIQVKRGWWLLLDHSVFYYLNHSCEPNAQVRFRGTSVKVVAVKPVRAGQELLIDYGSVAFADDPYRITCTCAARRCRGVVSGRRR
jgi:SET domain-containing protein